MSKNTKSDHLLKKNSPNSGQIKLPDGLADLSETTRAAIVLQYIKDNPLLLGQRKTLEIMRQARMTIKGTPYEDALYPDHKKELEIKSIRADFEARQPGGLR